MMAGPTSLSDGTRGALNAFFMDVHAKITSWGVASMLCSAILVLAYSYNPRVRRTPGWHFLYSSLCEFCVSFGFVALSLAGTGRRSPDFDLEHAMCHEYNALLLTILGFDMAANSWRLFMFVDLIVVYHNPFSPHTARPWYHAIVASLSLLWVLAIQNTEVLCMAGDDSNVNVMTLAWGLVYAPFVLFVLFGGSLYIMVRTLLSRGKTNTRIARLTRQRVMRHCLFYLLLYGVLLGLLAAGYASQFVSTSFTNRKVIAHFTAALTSGRPVFGFLGWSLVNILSENWTRCIAQESVLESPEWLKRSQQPLLESATENANGCSSIPRFEDVEGRLADRQGVREAGFKEELRYELVNDVAMGISELAQREARQQQQELSTRMAASDDDTTPTSPIPCATRDGIGLPTDTCGTTTTTSATESGGNIRMPHVDHYAVAHFRAIRDAFGISAESFADAFRRSRPESHDSARRFRESVSEGASGSFFYWVKNPDGSDTGYIVKQITKAEKDTLMSILPAYKAHVQSRGGNSLLQYLSCHSMRLRWELAGKVYFVVMRNFFPHRPQMSFDLKGATANRRALKTWELHQTNTVAGLYSTLRDWEWMDIGMTADLDERDKARIWWMICGDCDFLSRQHLLDYSLLLGIYRPPASQTPAEKQVLLKDIAARCKGIGCVSLDRQKVYFFGIIDILEKFSIRWRVQRACLRLLYALSMRWTSADGISAMPPVLYADRFRTFMAHEVLQMEEEPKQVILDEQWRAGRWCADACALCRRICGLPAQERAARRGGRERWQRLWERRRRGLVKQRIVSQHEDLLARITELEEKLRQYEYELACASGAHPKAALAEHRREPSPTQSFTQSLTGESIGL